MSIGVAVNVAAVTRVSSDSVYVENGKGPVFRKDRRGAAEELGENAPGIDSWSSRCKEDSLAVTWVTDGIPIVSPISKEANPSVTSEREG